MAVCQVAGISGAALILPCSLIDLEFDIDFLSTLLPPMLAGVALALMTRSGLIRKSSCLQIGPRNCDQLSRPRFDQGLW